MKVFGQPFKTEEPQSEPSQPVVVDLEAYKQAVPAMDYYQFLASQPSKEQFEEYMQAKRYRDMGFK